MREVPNFPIAMPSWLTISQTRVKDHTTNAEGRLDGQWSGKRRYQMTEEQSPRRCAENSRRLDIFPLA